MSPSYVDSARYNKNPNQISFFVFPFQPRLIFASPFELHVQQPNHTPAFSFPIVQRVCTCVDSRSSPYLIIRLLLEDDSSSKNNNLEYQSINKEFHSFLSDNKDVLDETTIMKLLERSPLLSKAPFQANV
ncbi:hypothetical protein GLYMA_08G214950v4 [Glycine max]|nr:hypothetical protein GLYMA_08G214950v4 [Glycine max]KAH1052404.1 hypothetical protein GYH30_021966 [Glycine max]